MKTIARFLYYMAGSIFLKNLSEAEKHGFRQRRNFRPRAKLGFRRWPEEPMVFHKIYYQS